MSDTASQPQFPDTERDDLRAALAESGLRMAQELIEGFTEPRQQMQLYALLTRIASQDLRPRASFNQAGPPAGTHWLTLDDLAGVYQAAFACADREMAESAGNPDEADWFKAQANVLCFNLCADLAPCWPWDNEPRAARHYGLGRLTARRAVRYRIELNKKAENFALAYWALGIHELGLDDAAEAAAAFAKAREHAAIAAGEYGRKGEVGPDGDWSFILNCGYLGLARALGGDMEGRTSYTAALAAFKGMAEAHPDMAEDANFGIAQLEKTAQVFGLAPAASPPSAVPPPPAAA